MSIKLSFQLELKEKAPINLAKLHGNLVAETIALGDLTFEIDDTDFSLTRLEILDFAIGLYRCVSETLATGSSRQYSFLEIDGGLQVSSAAQNKLILAYTVGRDGEPFQSAEIEGLVLLRASAGFLSSVLEECFNVYPDLLRNFSFLSTCPFAWELTRNKQSNSEIVWYPTDATPTDGSPDQILSSHGIIDATGIQKD